MSTLADDLKAMADDLGRHMKVYRDGASKKIKDVDAAIEHAQAFLAKKDGNYQCPHCYVEKDISIDLQPKNSDTKINIYLCKQCRRKYTSTP